MYSSVAPLLDTVQRSYHTPKILLRRVSLNRVAKPVDPLVAPETDHRKGDIWTDHDPSVTPMNQINLAPSSIQSLDHTDKSSSRSDKQFVSYRVRCHRVSHIKTHFSQTSPRHQFLFPQSSLPLYKLCSEPCKSD